MKKSYKGYIVWMILFCVGMVLMMIVDLKNLKLFSLILGNYMLMMITLLTGMIYKNECIYWYSGVSYQEAIEATSMSRKKYAYKHFIRFFITCLLYFILFNNSLFFIIFIWNEYDNLLFINYGVCPTRHLLDYKGVFYEFYYNVYKKYFDPLNVDESLLDIKDIVMHFL